MSVFSQVTIPPISISATNGRKQELVASHPGVDEPGAFCTVTSICDTCSTIGVGSTSTGSIPIMLTFELISSPIGMPPWSGQSVKKLVKT